MRKTVFRDPKTAICTLLISSCVAFTFAGAQVSELNKTTGSFNAAVVSPSAKTEIDQARSTEIFGALPLSFEINQGQTSPEARFISHGSGYTLFLTNDEAILKLAGQETGSARNKWAAKSPRPANESGARSPSTLRMRLLGAKASAQVTGVDEQPGKSNYLLGNDPTKWHTNVANFAKVKYEDIYSGIDLIYYGKQRQLEYDFVVAPGADPHAIQMQIGSDQSSSSRSTPLTVAANGDLVVTIDGRAIQLRKPLVYQADSAKKDFIPARWVVKSGDRVSFEVASYDRRKPLIIDPTLGFSTYLGGSVDDNTYSIGTDASANVYVTGTTESTDFPIQGAFQSGNAGNNDAFITKLNPTGTALVYSTYLGGSAADFAFSMAVNSSGNAYVAGTTQSTDFPTTSGAFQTTCPSCVSGLPSVFVTELNTTGSALTYSTFIGGSGDSRGYGIALDSSGNAYVTGRTSSTNYPTTTGAFQKTLNGVVNILVSKLNSTGSTLLYSTYLGGSGSDQANGIAVDASGNAYVAGSTTSTNFPTSTGAFQTTLRGASNAVVAKVNTQGTALAYSTYLGGNAADTVWGIRVDGTSNTYVVGQTTSTTFPTTAGAFQTACGGGCTVPDGFVTKINSTGTALTYSTFLGGSNEEEAFALAIDNSGNAYVTGRTNSTDFPLTKASFQTSLGGVFDAFVTILNPTGASLLYSTFLGGNGSDAGLGISVDAAKNVYVTGRAYSANFPTTPSAFATTCSTCSDTAYSDAFVTKFTAGDQIWPLALNFGSQQVGVTSPPMTAVLSNSSPTTLSITGLSLSGVNATDFAETNTCGTSLKGYASCKVDITVTPGATGALSAALSVADSAANSPQTVVLTGSGSNNSVTLNPTALTFTTQLVGTSSAAQNATLSNAGTTAVTIASIVASGQFTQTNNCGTILAATSSCTISVVFSPTAQGTVKGSVKITDDAAGSPQTLTLVGAATVVSLSPTSVNFGTQKVGSTSGAQTVTVMNHSNLAITLKKIAITGKGASQFTETNNCGTSLAAGASCKASVTFGPTATGSFSASLSVSDTGGGSPQLATLTGTGN